MADNTTNLYGSSATTGTGFSDKQSFNAAAVVSHLTTVKTNNDLILASCNAIVKSFRDNIESGDAIQGDAADLITFFDQSIVKMNNFSTFLDNVITQIGGGEVSTESGTTTTSSIAGAFDTLAKEVSSGFEASSTSSQE